MMTTNQARNLPATNQVRRRQASDLATRRRADLGRALGEQVAATLQAATRSEHSRRAYAVAIGLFLRYLGEALGEGALAETAKDGRRTTWAYRGDCAPLRRIEPGHLDAWRAWREGEGDAPNTVAQRAAAVSTFLAVAYRDGILTHRQALGLGVRPYKPRGRRDAQPTGRRLTREEARLLRDACDLGTRKGRRDRAILDLALFAGLRCEEIAQLAMDHLRQDGGRWWLVFAGKGEKTRRVKVHDVLFASLAAWLADTGRTIGGQAAGGGPVFASINKGDAIGTPGLGRAAINRLVAEYGETAGLAPLHGANRLGPHDLRRTCARNAYDNGAALPLIQRMLGHADVSTTMRYIGSDDDGNGGAVDFVRY